MKKLFFCLSALLAAASAGAGTVYTFYYMGDEYGNSAYGYVDPYNDNVGSTPVTFTATNTPAGWKIIDWLTAASADAIQSLDRCTSTGESSATYVWTGGTATASALAVRFGPISYTLGFDTAGGTPFSEAETGPYLSTNEISLAEYTGTLEGHSFVGWTNEYVTVAFDHTETFAGVEKFGLGNADTNVTLYAAWTANVFTVTFKFRDRRGAWTNVAQNVEYGTDAVPPSDDEVNIWPGHRFTVWSGSYEAVTKNVTVTAQYTESSYTVFFDPNAVDATGTMLEQSFDCGDERNLRKNAFKRNGYTFSAWNTEKDGSGDGYGDTEAVSDLTYEDGGIVTLYAQWKPIEYTIAFAGNEGSGEMAPTNVAYGVEVELPTNSFVNGGWTFKGWEYVDDTGAVTNRCADGATVKNLTTNDGATVTLVAQWGDFQSELQRAIHGNLLWDGIDGSGLNGDKKWTARFGEDEGFNGSGSCAEQEGMAGNALTAAVATNGVLSFYCRNVSSTDQARLYLVVNDSEYTFVAGSGLPDAIAILGPNEDWQQKSIEIDFSQYQESDVLYVHLAVLSGTVQIDQMTWTPEGGDDPDAPIGMTLTGYSGKYDGAAHGVAVGGTNGIAGVSCVFATGETLPEDGWTDEAPTVTNVGTTKVWCVASAPGRITETNSATVAVSPREVTLTSGDASKEYDGNALTNGIVVVGGDGFAGGEGATFDVTGSQTDVGSSKNTFTYELDEGTTAGNYSISTTFGTLTVTQASYDMDGVAWDYSAPFDYDGKKKTVELVGLPDGLSVSYAGNSARSPGVYNAVATFASDSNHVVPEPTNLVWEIVLPEGGVFFPGEGTVTVPKTWKVGKAATWNAKAAKGSVFAHWEGKLVDNLGLSRNELRNPSLKFIVPEGFDTNDVDAVFVSFDSDGLSSLSLSSDKALDLGVAVEGLEIFDDSESYVTASVSGLPTGLKFDAKTLKITGKPTKSGVFWAQIKAKNASGYQWAENVRMTVSGGGAAAREPKLTRTAYYPLTVVSSDLAAGTVSGTGVYAEGKKASISAKSAKNKSFAGWYRDAKLTEPMGFASGDYRKAAQSVVVPEVRCLFAKFVDATAEADPLSDLSAKGPGFSDMESSFKWRVGVAVPEGDGIEFISASLPSASAAKLPAGVKFDAEKCRFIGVPTKAGTYEAIVTVKNASKSTGQLKLAIEVAALDDWAQGTFNGAAFDGDNNPTGLVSTLTVGANGKISGKLLRDGLTWTLSAASYGSYDETGVAYVATVIGKSGKLQITNEVTVTAGSIAAPGGGEAVRGVAVADCGEWQAWQNLWKAEPWKTEAKSCAKAKALPIGEVTLKFAAAGAVTAKGAFVIDKNAQGRDVVYSSTCSSVLVARGGASYSVFVYFPPKAGKFDGLAAEMPLLWDGENFSIAPIDAP